VKSVLCLHSDTGACGNFRVIEVYQNIVSDIKFIISDQLSDAWLSDDDDDMVDAVILQRPSDPKCLRFIREFKERKGVVVVETDDDLLNIPHSNPVFPFLKQEGRSVYESCLKECDYAHVSTTELSIGNKSVVFPNAINLKKYGSPMAKRERSVVWAGSPTHKDSLELIKPVIEELVHNNIEVVLMSDRNWLHSIFKSHKNLIIEDWLPFDFSYVLPSKAHIFLTPLPDNVFNSKKSELKILEAAAWKVPCVSSDVSPYRRFHELSNGANLLVKKERPKYWLENIYKLLSDDALYKSCAEKSYLCVTTRYNLQTINKLRSEWWSKILTA